LTAKVTASVEEVARLLGIGRTTAYELASRDKLPVTTIRVGRQLRVPVAGLARALGLTVEEVIAAIDD
jgi:excisionase family DNA binding protein